MSKQDALALGFSKATQPNTHETKSTSGGAFAGFPQLPHLKLKRYILLPLWFVVFTSKCHRTVDP
jgi:hypothetical protein